MRFRRLVLALALCLALLAILALGCGPTAPAEQDEPTPEPTLPWLGTPPTAEELATSEPYLDLSLEAARQGSVALTLTRLETLITTAANRP